MSVDVVIHILDNNITEKDISMFFSNCLGSKHFNLSRYNPKEFDRLYDKFMNTTKFDLCEVIDHPYPDDQKIINIIREALPTIDDSLINKIRPHARDDLLLWLEEHKGKQIFIVHW